jgi:hypothetical protein
MSAAKCDYQGFNTNKEKTDLIAENTGYYKLRSRSRDRKSLSHLSGVPLIKSLLDNNEMCSTFSYSH